MTQISLSKRVSLNPEKFMKEAIHSAKMRRVTNKILKKAGENRTEYCHNIDNYLLDGYVW